MSARAVTAAGAHLARARGRSARHGAGPDRRPPQQPFAPGPRLDRERAIVELPRASRRSRDWLDRYPPSPRTTPSSTGRGIGRSTSGRARRARSRGARSRTHRARARGVDRAAGRVDDGPGRRRRLRRTRRSTARGSGSPSAASSSLGLADRAGPCRSGSSTSSRCSPSPSRSGLRPRASLLERPARVPAAPVPARARVGSAARAAAGGHEPLARAALLAASVFLPGFRVGVNVEGRGTVIDVGYAGVIGGRPDPPRQAPYGHMPISDDPPRAARPTPLATPARISDRRALRECERLRRHLRPGRVPRVRPRFSRSAGRGGGPTPSVRARSLDRLRHPRLAVGLGARRSPLRRREARRAAPVRVGGVPFTALRHDLRHERCDHARAARLEPPVRAAVGARRRSRPRRLDEVRGPSQLSRSGPTYPPRFDWRARF